MTVETYIPGQEKNEAFYAMEKMMAGRDEGVSYADMIRLRLNGEAAKECSDTYYVAREEKTPLCRLWMGFGKHPFAIGNWGNFFTAEEARGKGVGGKVLQFWYEDLKRREDLPLALFCSAATEELTSLYARYGWRCAMEGAKKGSLYLPLGSSPENFGDFCKEYYLPTRRLIRKEASVGYRHEIDCLLKFARKREGMPFGFEEVKSIEEILL
ncbi:MAG: GNAT family N-acetyltransferase, partial [Clostridia bacterium]|nr:GNAT family N-acetyltransferase [Clostridia bacterium]